jgi:mannose/fructose-specific phosphotransferase system component IIA
MKKKVILASHGQLAQGMASACRMIAGEHSCLATFGLEDAESPQTLVEEIKQWIDKDPDSFYVIICDLKGGSVWNQALRLASKNVALIAGMNLGLVLEILLFQGDLSNLETLGSLVKKSHKGIELFDYEKAMSTHLNEEDELW